MSDEIKAVELSEEDLDEVAGGAKVGSYIAKCSCGWEGPSGLSKKGAEEAASDHKDDTGCAGTITYVCV